MLLWKYQYLECRLLPLEMIRSNHPLDCRFRYLEAAGANATAMRCSLCPYIRRGSEASASLSQVLLFPNPGPTLRVQRYMLPFQASVLTRPFDTGSPDRQRAGCRGCIAEVLL